MASKTQLSSARKLLEEFGEADFAGLQTAEAGWTQALLDSLASPVIYVDPGQIVRVVNDATCKLLARKPGSLIDKHLNDVVVSTRDPSGDPFDLAGAVIRSVAESESREVGPFLLKKRIGKTEPVSVLLEPHGQRGRDDAGCALVIRQVAPEESGEKLRDTILSMVSHELRTPLLHIKGFVSSLLQTDVEWDSETRLDFLQTIDHEADRLTSLVEDLMDISALQAGQLPLTLEKLGPYLLVHQGIDEATPYTSEHKIKVDIGDDLPDVKVDNTWIVTVLVNLLQNAARHSAPETTISVGAKRIGQTVQFSVEDVGPGIPPEGRQDVFDPFYRGKERSVIGKGKTAGTGLGLAVSRAAVEAHGGQIWVDSSDYGGARFSFTIPV